MLMNSLFVLFFLLFSCQESNKKVQKRLENKVNLNEKFSKPDFKINLLELRNENTLAKFYSSNIKLQDRLRYSPVVVFENKDKTKYLITYHYDGDVKYAFSCFEIGYLKDDHKLKNGIVTTNYENFTTESGVKLGMSLQEIINLKGNDYKVEKKSNEEIIRYTIDNPDNPKIKQYEMPPYFMEFYLKDNKVYKIIFGFEYP